MTASGISPYAQHLVDSLGLAKHPEGGWYRRTWQSSAAATGDATNMGEDSTEGRPLASLIYFLLPAGDASAWHVVDADEAWLWHGPGAVTLEIAGSGSEPDESQVERIVLSLDENGARTQFVVPAGVWQRTVPADEDALVSCMVSPGFVYAGFTLASGQASCE